VDGDAVLWESNSILRYLARKAKSPLYPSDFAARAEVEKWMDWLLATLNGPYVNIFKATKAGDAAPEGPAKEMIAALQIMIV